MLAPIDCPALHERRDGYPFGDRVPRKVRMRKTVIADPMPVVGFAMCKDGMPPVALINQVLPAWTSSHGAVLVVLADGQKLGVKPDEFEVVDWHDLPKGMIDLHELIQEVNRVRKKFMMEHVEAPRTIVFPDSRRTQMVVWQAAFPKNERHTDELQGCTQFGGLEVRFSPHIHETVCGQA